MAKVQNFSGISPDLPFTEFDFYELYRRTFATSELGKIRKRPPNDSPYFINQFGNNSLFTSEKKDDP